MPAIPDADSVWPILDLICTMRYKQEKAGRKLSTYRAHEERIVWRSIVCKNAADCGNFKRITNWSACSMALDVTGHVVRKAPSSRIRMANCGFLAFGTWVCYSPSLAVAVHSCIISAHCISVLCMYCIGFLTNSPLYLE